jgi:cytochrome b6-f complex iron-sulfur subunit
MSTAAVIAIAIGAVVVLGALAFFTLARRSDVRGAGALSGETVHRDRDARREREQEAVAAERPVTTAAQVEASARTATLVPVEESTVELEPWEPPDPELVGVSRRQFFNRATVTLMSAGIGAFAAAAFVAFLWPSGTGGFGGQVNVGKIGNIKDGIKQGGGFFYAPEARSWITEYPAEALPAAETVYPESLLVAMRAGLTILSQKCPHLGCRVPACLTSQWFECQCHGSQYNRNGEKKAGPAPRGMDRFPTVISGSGDVVINTGAVVLGPAIGTNTTGQEAEGPHCTGGGEHH